jgi:DNA polymerase-3 subunit epsilon
MNFTAIDFETATYDRDSACAVGIVTVEGHQIVDTYYTLIRPPGNHYYAKNIDVHGIHPHETENEKPFAEIFPDIADRIYGQTVVAHNAPFDRTVLQHCMTSSGLDYEHLDITDRWQCTLQIYRKKGFKPCRLSDCCRALNISLDHHHAMSDALGCAELYLRK